jgi:LPS-assembly lipoprotein
VALPKAMGKTYIQGATPYSDLETDLRRALGNAGAQVIAVPQDAAQLRILHEEFGRRVLTVAVTGKAREYELFYTVDFEVSGADGKQLLSHQSQTLTRDFTFDETQLLGKTNEEDLLHGEMRREMVQRILRRIERAPAE